MTMVGEWHTVTFVILRSAVRRVSKDDDAVTLCAQVLVG
jgi:hypothetical protein